MSNLAGFVGAFYIGSDAYTAVSDEAVGSGSGSDVSFSLAYGNVDTEGLTVSVSDATQSYIADYALNPNGTLIFTTAPANGYAVVASYRYYPNMLQAGGFTTWSADVTADTLDTTDFESTGYRTFMAGLKTWTVSAERHWKDSHLIDQAGNRVLAKMYADETNSDYFTGWGILNGVNPTTPVDALVDESISIQGKDGIYTG